MPTKLQLQHLARLRLGKLVTGANFVVKRIKILTLIV